MVALDACAIDPELQVGQSVTISVDAFGGKDFTGKVDSIQAGTSVVWDLDPRVPCIRAYRPDAPDRPSTFHPGQVADAEPAVPGWRMAVDAMEHS